MNSLNSYIVNFFILIILLTGTPSFHPHFSVQQKFAVSPLAKSKEDSLLVEAFYARNHQKLFWFFPGPGSVELRKTLRQSIDSSINFGLNKYKYHYDTVLKYCDAPFFHESQSMLSVDRILTDAAIKFCQDIYRGENVGAWIISDEISEKYRQKDVDFILSGLVNSSNAKKYMEFVSCLMPKDSNYLILQSAISDSFRATNPAAVKQLAISLNLLRWIEHFQLDRYIVVNIGSATLRYYENDSIKLQMKVVVGKPSTRTPRFAAYCNEIILYPYWNVPRKIVLNELLPIFKAMPNMVDSMNMQIIDRYGRVVGVDTMNWHLYNRNFFPYEVRQSTGCDNALGVIKYNLTSPFAVYMHDTNLKSAFKSDRRYFSHGCIRLEKPIELANYLLNNQLDSNFLQSCLKNQSPIPINIEKQVPVFVTYLTAEASEGKVKYYKDVYKLMQ